MFASGRWHNVGKQIIYVAESPALALLEALVQFEEEEALPADYQLLEIEVPDLKTEEWRGDLPDIETSVAWGDHWLAEGSIALAKVPAAIAPHSFNYLINPLHPDAAGVRLIGAQRWDWDDRLAR